ncbi:unnamed protein product [Debaryomyces tyrocola]|nr:unnamed protein product [Debaryomyces tyrocola]
MTESSRYLVLELLLYLAIFKCVEDELEIYDYHYFFPELELITNSTALLDITVSEFPFEEVKKVKDN